MTPSRILTESIVDALETEAEGSPERQVVEPDEPVDAEPRIAVVPGRRAEEPAEDAAARVLDAEDADPVDGGTHCRSTVPHPIVHGLEQRLRQSVHGDVHETARTSPARVQPDEERIDRPARQSVDQEAPTRVQTASSSRSGSDDHLTSVPIRLGIVPFGLTRIHAPAEVCGLAPSLSSGSR